MKKIILLLIIGMLLVSTVVAYRYAASNKADAIAEIKNIKGLLDTRLELITYTTDKECFVDYLSEEVTTCQVCFNMTAGEFLPEINHRCINVNETMPASQIDNEIRSYIEGQIKEKYENGEYKFTDLATKGRAFYR